MIASTTITAMRISRRRLDRGDGVDRDEGALRPGARAARELQRERLTAGGAAKADRAGCGDAPQHPLELIEGEDRPAVQAVDPSAGEELAVRRTSRADGLH